jgi:hypothetical protein
MRVPIRGIEPALPLSFHGPIFANAAPFRWAALLVSMISENCSATASPPDRRRKFTVFDECSGPSLRSRKCVLNAMSGSSPCLETAPALPRPDRAGAVSAAGGNLGNSGDSPNSIGCRLFPGLNSSPNLNWQPFDGARRRRLCVRLIRSPPVYGCYRRQRDAQRSPP